MEKKCIDNGERIDIHERLATIETILKEIKEKVDQGAKAYTRVKVHEAVVCAVVVLIGLVFGAIRAYAAIFGG